MSNLLTPQETANYLGIKLNTLAVWRSTKRYNLSFVKVGRKIMYELEGIRKFIEKRRIENYVDINNG